MKKGLSIIEVMFALTLVAVIMAATSPVLIGAMQTNGDSRIKAQAIAAAEIWHDRFRAKTLSFPDFQNGVEFDYSHDYATDTTINFQDAGAQNLNDAWQDYKFIVTTTQDLALPGTVWRVDVETFYRRSLGNDSSAASPSTTPKEGSFEISTLIEQ